MYVGRKDNVSRRKSKLRATLYKLAETAALSVVSNENYIRALQEKRLNAITQMAGRIGGMATSACTFVSAFSVSSEVVGFSVAPLSSWLTAGPVVAKTATITTCINPWMAAAGAAFTIWNFYQAWDNAQDQNQLQQEIEYLEESEYLFYSVFSVAFSNKHSQDFMANRVTYSYCLQ